MQVLESPDFNDTSMDDNLKRKKEINLRNSNEQVLRQHIFFQDDSESEFVCKCFLCRFSLMNEKAPLILFTMSIYYSRQRSRRKYLRQNEYC